MSKAFKLSAGAVNESFILFFNIYNYSKMQKLTWTTKKLNSLIHYCNIISTMKYHNRVRTSGKHTRTIISTLS